MTGALTTVVVRGFGYAITHAALVPAAAIIDHGWPNPDYPFEAVRTPVVARCGTSVRSLRPVVVIMQPGTRVSCAWCRSRAAA